MHGISRANLVVEIYRISSRVHESSIPDRHSDRCYGPEYTPSILFGPDVPHIPIEYGCAATYLLTEDVDAMEVFTFAEI